MTHMRRRFIPRSLCFPPVPEARAGAGAGAFGAGGAADSAGMDFQAGLSVAL